MKTLNQYFKDEKVREAVELASEAINLLDKFDFDFVLSVVSYIIEKKLQCATKEDFYLVLALCYQQMHQKT